MRTTTSQPFHPRRSGPALGALAVMLFCFFTSEVFVAGAMSPMSRDLHRSPATLGSLVTIYATVAAVSVLPMTGLARRIPARSMLLAAVVVLATAQGLMAAVPSWPMIVTARGATALFHGPVWALAPVIASQLDPERPARATAIVFLGSSVGNVAGAPLVATMSDHMSWRWASTLLAVLAATSAVTLARLLPHRTSTTNDPTPAATAERSSRRNVLLLCAAVIILASAHLCAYTYIGPDSQGAGIPDRWLPALLLAMGVAGAMGTAFSSRAADAHPRLLLITAATAMGLGLAATSAHSIVFLVGTTIWSIAYAALIAVLPARVVHTAPTWSTTASAWYVLAFQIGIAAGSSIGAHTPNRAITSALLTLTAIPGLVATSHRN